MESEHNAAHDLQVFADDPSFAEALDYVRSRGGEATLQSGETALEHAAGTARILLSLGVDRPSLLAALVYPAVFLESGSDAPRLQERFGEEVARLVGDVRRLSELGVVGLRAPLGAPPREAEAQRLAHVESLRKLLLAFAQDIRVVLIRLASRLQTLRFHAGNKTEPAETVADETLEIYAPLANRLGIWQIKWELEDLAFRFKDPDTYRRIARMLDEKRVERQSFVAQAIARLRQEIGAAGIEAEVSGRPKHIYSIWRKMRGKELDFRELYDVRAFRVIVEDVKDCYAVLGIVHHVWQPIPKEFDDYISRPKPNGYRSLHTVVVGEDGRAFEVQIRTREMHHFAEYGVAAHWRYKEAGARGYAGQAMADGAYDDKIAWLRQLLAWKDEVSREGGAAASAWDQIKQTEPDDHIYVLTPQARVVALPQGATPVDFAYHVHSELGHRCRGARVDGSMVPLNTALANGQTVEIIAVKQGGPSRDWLNPQLGYLQSARARTKVRAWFHAAELKESIAAGRALVEKTLQREGRTAVNLDDLAARLGFKNADALFAAAAKEEFSQRSIELALSGSPHDEAPREDTIVAKQSSGSSVARGASSGVLVVGVGALLTQLARCCRPAPPDAIAGFVTRGKGVSIHRASCPNFARMAHSAPERVLDAAWSQADLDNASSRTVYPVDLVIEAIDRQGLLRDISEVFSREKINVVGVHTASRREQATMQFTVEVTDAARLQRAIAVLGEVPGVHRAVRKA